MPSKPIVVYIESDHGSGISGGDNHEKRGMLNVLLNTFHFEVRDYSYDDYFYNKMNEFIQLYNNGWLACIIVKQGEYDDDEVKLVKKVRRKLSKTIPIIVLETHRRHSFSDEDGENFEELPVDDNILLTDYYKPALLAKLRKIAKSWRPKFPDFFGADTPAEQAILVKQLAHSYAASFDAEDACFDCPKDHNSQTVLQALRLRQLPPEFVKETFDDTLKSMPVKEFSQKSVDKQTYQSELEKIRSLSPEERKTLDDSIQINRGYIPYADGGVRVVSASCGGNVNGFAIDTITLEFATTRGFGEHHLVDSFLAQRLGAIEGIQNSDWKKSLGAFRNYDLKHRMITGLIHFDIDGYTTPLVVLYEYNYHDPVNVNRVLRRIFELRRWIPLDYEANLIEQVPEN